VEVVGMTWNVKKQTPDIDMLLHVDIRCFMLVVTMWMICLLNQKQSNTFRKRIDLNDHLLSFVP
ncbi:hypothetical protein ACQGS6_21495, partial [Bacillus sp. GMs2/2]|uniref:hypothetical protein n=1 Tax=Bacillus sp. GMs2/2 TaxID=3418494 RepID=UPI003CF9796D